jgi:hypothetical protein
MMREFAATEAACREPPVVGKGKRERREEGKQKTARRIDDAWCVRGTPSNGYQI